MIWVYISLAVLILLIIFFFVTGFYMFNLALARRADKQIVKGSFNRYGDGTKATPDHPLYISDELYEWFDKSTEKISISSQGNTLQGYILNQNEYSEKWAIVIHGWTSKATSMIKYGQKYFEKGYSVLYVDLAAHGKSEGKYATMGWKDKEDIKKWIDQIINRDKNAKIVLHGVSMGAATVMFTACEKLPENVIACIEDCGYTSVFDILKYQLKRLFPYISTFPTVNISSTICKAYLGFTFKEASVVKQLKNSQYNIPLMFIHGSLDSFVPFEMVYKLYDSYKSSKKELYVVKDAEHINSWAVAKEDYWIKIFSFINKYTNL